MNIKLLNWWNNKQLSYNEKVNFLIDFSTSKHIPQKWKDETKEFLKIVERQKNEKR
tara:strand:+ start:1045 stop:1212 length:168 start_codon:yes stop_codon:yes gene_type:complete